MLSEDDQASQIRILVVGSGPISMFFASRLQASGGAEITVVNKSKDMSQKSSKVYKIKSPVTLGYTIYKPSQVVSTISEAVQSSNQIFDYVFVSIKAIPQLYSISEIIKPAITPNKTCIIYNSTTTWSGEFPLIDAFPDNLVISFVSFMTFNHSSPDLIDHVGGYDIKIGVLPGSGDRLGKDIRKDALDCLVLMSEVGRLTCSIEENILPFFWERMIGPILFDSISILSSMSVNADIFKDPNGNRLLHECLDELLNIAVVDGQFSIEESNRLRDTMIPKMLKPEDAITTPMRLDAKSGRPLELATTVEYPLKIAKKHNISTPKLDALACLLRMIDISNIEKGKANRSSGNQLIPRRPSTSSLQQLTSSPRRPLSEANNARPENSLEILHQRTQKPMKRKQKIHNQVIIDTPPHSQTSSISKDDVYQLEDLIDLVITPEQLDMPPVDSVSAASGPKGDDLSLKTRPRRAASAPVDCLVGKPVGFGKSPRHQSKQSSDIKARYARALANSDDEDSNDDEDDYEDFPDSVSERQRSASVLGFNLTDDMSLDDVDVMSLTGRRTREMLMGVSYYESEEFVGVDGEGRSRSVMSMGSTRSSVFSTSTLHVGRLRNPAARKATARALSTPLGETFRSDSLESYAAVLYTPDEQGPRRPTGETRRYSSATDITIQSLPAPRSKLSRTHMSVDTNDRYQSILWPKTQRSESPVYSTHSQGASVKRIGKHNLSIVSLPSLPVLAAAEGANKSQRNPIPFVSPQSCQDSLSSGVSSPTGSAPSHPRSMSFNLALQTPPTSADEDESTSTPSYFSTKIPPMDMWTSKEPLSLKSKLVPPKSRVRLLSSWSKKLGFGS